MTVITANDGKTYKLPKKPVWRTGPPPSVGWWPATNAGVNTMETREACEYLTFLRWWDGEHWSRNPAFPKHSSAFAGKQSNGEKSPVRIYWTDRWWESQ